MGGVSSSHPYIPTVATVLTPPRPVGRPRKISKRVTLNYEALDALTRGLVEGYAEVARQVLAAADPRVPVLDPGSYWATHINPKTEKPYRVSGELKTQGGFGVWVDGKKVVGPAKKPRRIPRTGIYAIVGYGGHIAHLQEFGTIHQPARPFFTPALNEVMPNHVAIIRRYVTFRVRKVKNPTSPKAA
jgi:HK97 gp10 family phage protein